MNITVSAYKLLAAISLVLLALLNVSPANATGGDSIPINDRNVFAEIVTIAKLPVAVEHLDGPNLEYFLIDKNGTWRKVSSDGLPGQVIIAQSAANEYAETGATHQSLGGLLGTTSGIPELEAKLSQPYKYSFSYVIWPDPNGSHGQAKGYFKKLNQKMGEVFPLKGLPSTLRKGRTYFLQPGRNPVKVLSVSTDNFALKSLPGHLEGAGKIINFRLMYDGKAYRLNVFAQGPATAWQQRPIQQVGNKLFAYSMWSSFACRIRESVIVRPCI